MFRDTERTRHGSAPVKAPSCPLHVAVVGCGKIADAHAEEIHKLDGRAKVVAACDRELLLAEQYAARYRIPRHYARLDELLDREKPDVVHITTPPQSHLAIAKQALAAGCHVYVEKPFAMNAQDAEALLHAARAANRKVTVGYFSYFDPPALMMRELIREGAIGDVVHVESFYGYDLSGPFGKALLADSSHWVHRLPGKLFQNVIDHMLNKVAEFVTDDAPRIQAFGYARRPQRFGDERDQLLDELRVSLLGERVSGYATFSSHIRPMGQFVRVCGTKSTVRVDYANRTVTFEAAPTLPSAIGRLLPAFQNAWGFVKAGADNTLRFARADFQYFSGMKELISRFYDSIENDAPLPIAERDILRIARIMDEIFRQISPEGGRS